MNRTIIPQGSLLERQLVRVDVRSSTASGVCGPDANVVDVDLPEVPEGEVWLLERLVLVCAHHDEVRGYVFDTEAIDRNIVDTTQHANLDVAEYPQAVPLEAGHWLKVRWLDVQPGTEVSARAQFGVGVRVGRAA